MLSALAQALSSSQFASTYGGQVRDIKMQIWGKCIHMPHRVSVACRAATLCKAAEPPLCRLGAGASGRQLYYVKWGLSKFDLVGIT